MDLKELKDKPVVGGIWSNFDKIPGTRMHELIATLPQVVITRVNGFCFTGALDLVLASDLVVAAEDAVIAQLCDQIMDNSAQSIAAHKTLHQAENMNLAEGLAFERKARFDITDSSERMAAFQKVRD